MANAEDAKLPARAITMAVEYPGVEIPKDEDVSMDLIFHNKGRNHEDVKVTIAEKPKGWRAKIKTYRYKVSGIHVPSNQDKSSFLVQSAADQHSSASKIISIQEAITSNDFSSVDSSSLKSKLF